MTDTTVRADPDKSAARWADHDVAVAAALAKLQTLLTLARAAVAMPKLGRPERPATKAPPVKFKSMDLI